MKMIILIEDLCHSQIIHLNFSLKDSFILLLVKKIGAPILCQNLDYVVGRRI